MSVYTVRLRITAEHFDNKADPIHFRLPEWRQEVENLIDLTIPDFLLLTDILWSDSDIVTLTLEDPRSMNPKIIQDLINENYKNAETYYDAERGIKLKIRL